jgi:hypothetical protein
MSEGGSGRVRLRQAVLVARDLDEVAAGLQRELGLQDPFRDPGVAEFGLENVVFAIGDCFLEVVSPARPGTAAGRQIERAGGDGGYMVLFDIEDLDGARARAEELGVRTVWRIDLPDISGTHMHPADMRGAIVSLDRSIPYGSWRWGGPDWTGRTGSAPAGALAGVTVAVADPQAAAERWSEVLAVPAEQALEPSLILDGGRVQFRAASAGEPDGVVGIALQLPAKVRAGREAIMVGNARIELADLAV